MKKAFILASVLLTSFSAYSQDNIVSAFSKFNLSASLGTAWNLSKQTTLGRTCLEPKPNHLIIESDTDISLRIRNANHLLSLLGVSSIEKIQDLRLRNVANSIQTEEPNKISILYLYRKSYRLSASEFQPKCETVRNVDVIHDNGLTWKGQCGSAFVDYTKVGKSLIMSYEFTFKDSGTKTKFAKAIEKADDSTLANLMSSVSEVSALRKKKSFQLNHSVFQMGGGDIPSSASSLLSCYENGLEGCLAALKLSSDDAERFLEENNPSSEELPLLATVAGRNAFNLAVLEASGRSYDNENWAQGKFDSDLRKGCGL